MWVQGRTGTCQIRGGGVLEQLPIQEEHCCGCVGCGRYFGIQYQARRYNDVYIEAMSNTTMLGVGMPYSVFMLQQKSHAGTRILLVDHVFEVQYGGGQIMHAVQLHEGFTSFLTTGSR